MADASRKINLSLFVNNTAITWNIRPYTVRRGQHTFYTLTIGTGRFLLHDLHPHSTVVPFHRHLYPYRNGQALHYCETNQDFWEFGQRGRGEERDLSEVIPSTAANMFSVSYTVFHLHSLFIGYIGEATKLSKSRSSLFFLQSNARPEVVITMHLFVRTRTPGPIKR